MQYHDTFSDRRHLVDNLIVDFDATNTESLYRATEGAHLFSAKNPSNDTLYTDPLYAPPPPTYQGNYHPYRSQKIVPPENRSYRRNGYSVRSPERNAIGRRRSNVDQQTTPDNLPFIRGRSASGAMPSFPAYKKNDLFENIHHEGPQRAVKPRRQRPRSATEISPVYPPSFVPEYVDDSRLSGIGSEDNASLEFLDLFPPEWDSLSLDSLDFDLGENPSNQNPPNPPPRSANPSYPPPTHQVIQQHTNIYQSTNNMNMGHPPFLQTNVMHSPTPVSEYFLGEPPYSPTTRQGRGNSYENMFEMNHHNSGGHQHYPPHNGVPYYPSNPTTHISYSPSPPISPPIIPGVPTIIEYPVNQQKRRKRKSSSVRVGKRALKWTNATNSIQQKYGLSSPPPISPTASPTAIFPKYAPKTNTMDAKEEVSGSSHKVNQKQLTTNWKCTTYKI